MRKAILTILICGIILLGVTSCNLSNDFDIGGISDIEINNNDVSLSIKDGTLENTGVTLTLTNDSDKLLYYDEFYEMEIKKDNEWHKINVELFFTEPLWNIEKNSKEEIELNWEYGYGKLAKGDYRIIKKVYFENEQDQAFYISTEFTIK